MPLTPNKNPESRPTSNSLRRARWFMASRNEPFAGRAGDWCGVESDREDVGRLQDRRSGSRSTLAEDAADDEPAEVVQDGGSAGPPAPRCVLERHGDPATDGGLSRVSGKSSRPACRPRGAAFARPGNDGRKKRKNSSGSEGPVPFSGAHDPAFEKCRVEWWMSRWMDKRAGRRCFEGIDTDLSLTLVFSPKITPRPNRLRKVLRSAVRWLLQSRRQGR